MSTARLIMQTDVVIWSVVGLLNASVFMLRASAGAWDVALVHLLVLVAVTKIFLLLAQKAGDIND